MQFACCKSVLVTCVKRNACFGVRRPSPVVIVLQGKVPRETCCEVLNVVSVKFQRWLERRSRPLCRNATPISPTTSSTPLHAAHLHKAFAGFRKLPELQTMVCIAPTLSCCNHRSLSLKKCRQLIAKDMGLPENGLDGEKKYVLELIDAVRSAALTCWEHCPPRPS